MINFGRSNKFVPSFNSNLMQQSPQLGANLFRPPVRQALPINARELGPFGFNQPVPQAPRIPGVNVPIDFTAETERIYGNRPHKLAYQQAVEEGAPQIDRGNWAKLGAMLAAGGTALGQNSATAGYNLGRSAYEAPQMRADEAYDRKIKGLGDLANLEERDIAGRLSALEAKNRNYWAGREDVRAERAEGRADRGETRADRLADSQITNSALQNIEFIKSEDGNTYAYDRGSKTKLLVDKTHLSTAEAEASAARTLANQEEVKGYYTWLSNKQQAASSLANVKANIEGKEEVERMKIDQKREAAILNIRQKAAAMPPNSVAGFVMLDMAEAMKGPNPRLPADADDYLDWDENGVPVSKKPFWGGDSATEVIVRDFIGESIAKNRSGGISGTGGSTSTNRNTGATAGIPGSRYPRNEDNTVPMIDPEGIKFDANPDEVPELIKEGAKVGYPASLSGRSNAPGIPGSKASTPEEAFVPYRPPTPIPPPPNGSSIAPPAFNVTPTPTPINRNTAAAGLGATLPSTSPILSTEMPSVNVPETAPYGATAPVTGGRNIPTNPIQLAPSVANKPAVPLPQSGWAARSSPPPVPLPPNPIKISPTNAELGFNAAPAAKFNDALTSIVREVESQTGLKLRVASKDRSAAKQAELFAQGRTTKGPIVTNADGVTKQSKHQSGEAADLIFVDKNGKAIKADKKLWDILGSVAKKHGLTWGGDWKSLYDPGHIQLGGASGERKNQ